jgi:hypothetical protein
MGKYIVIVPLLALLGAALWFAINAWMSTAGPMPVDGYIAMGLGIAFSLVVGCGLMALMFYSSRRGYDAAAQFDPNDEGPQA